MASKNILLGSGVSYDELISPQRDEVNKYTPCWRYSKDFPKGVLIKSDKVLEGLDSAIWKDHPGKVTKLPGHELLFEEEIVNDKSVKGSIFDLSGIDVKEK
jgi:hypothetical protein